MYYTVLPQTVLYCTLLYSAAMYRTLLHILQVVLYCTA